MLTTEIQQKIITVKYAGLGYSSMVRRETHEIFQIYCNKLKKEKNYVKHFVRKKKLYIFQKICASLKGNLTT